MAITDGKMRHTWCGPLIVTAMENAPVPQTTELKMGVMTVNVPAGNAFPRVRDVEMGDLRIVVDYLLEYP